MIKNKKYIFLIMCIVIIFVQLILKPNISMGIYDDLIKGTETTKKEETTTKKEDTSSSMSSSTGQGSQAGQSVGDKLGLGNLDDYQGKKTESPLFQKKLSVIFGAIRIVGTILSVIILISIGIKYMLGSAEEKADYKKTLIPYILGTFFLFATSVLPQIIYEFMQSLGWI